jgi:hypothetical protein
LFVGRCLGVVASLAALGDFIVAGLNFLPPLACEPALDDFPTLLCCVDADALNPKPDSIFIRFAPVAPLT